MWSIESSFIVTFGILVLLFNSGTAHHIKDHGCNEMLTVKHGSPVSFSNVVKGRVAPACRWFIRQSSDAELKCELAKSYPKFLWSSCEGGVTVHRVPHRIINLKDARKPQKFCTSGEKTISLPFTHDGLGHSTEIKFNDIMPDGEARNAVLLCTVTSV